MKMYARTPSLLDTQNRLALYNNTFLATQNSTTTMIITIGGAPGSGKGTVGRLLAKRLSYEYTSMGDVWDAARQEKGMTSNEFHEYLHSHPEFDNELDRRQAELGKRDNIIVDSRLGFHFISHAFKVYLAVTPEEGARRVFSAHRGEEKYASAAEAYSELIKRQQHERKQHVQLYGVDSHDKKNFDLVVDTSKLTPEAVVEKIVEKLKK